MASRTPIEILNQGEIEIVEQGFTQDEKYQLSNFGGVDQIVHEGAEQWLSLNADFNLRHTQQPAELITNRPFRMISWGVEKNEWISRGKTEEEAVKLVLRKRFPLRVKIVQGVVYSPSERVILESLGLIRNFHQQKIVENQVFCEVPPLPVVSRQASQAREQATLLTTTTAPSQDLALLVNTQMKPLTRAPSWSTSSYGQGRGGCVDFWHTQTQPSTSYQAPKRARTETMEMDEQPSTSQQAQHQSMQNGPTYGDLMNATRIIGEFFNDELFRTFKVHFDKNAANIGEVKPSSRLLDVGYKVYHTKRTPCETNTTKLFSELFDTDKCQVVLYKKKNSLTGQRVPFSLRESSEILTQIVNSALSGLESLANLHREKDMEAAMRLTGEARENAFGMAAAAFEEKLHKIGKI